MKAEKQYQEAARFMSSLKMTFADIRSLTEGYEKDFIISRAKELKIPFIDEYINFIKNNKK